MECVQVFSKHQMLRTRKMCARKTTRIGYIKIIIMSVQDNRPLILLVCPTAWQATICSMQRQLQVPSLYFFIFAIHVATLTMTMFSTQWWSVTSSNRQRALAKRERYNNMNEHGKENMLQRKRDYKKKMRTQSAGDLAKETLHTVQNDIEYDGALFEPINNQSDEGVFIFFFPTKKHVYFILFW